MLFALAITSFKYWMKPLGKNWSRLHKLVYVIGAVTVLHYALAVKVSGLERWCGLRKILVFPIMNRSQVGIHAHAWVEMTGQAIGEAKDIGEQFTSLRYN